MRRLAPLGLAAVAALLLVGDLSFVARFAADLSLTALWWNLTLACALTLGAGMLSLYAVRHARFHAERMALAVAGATDGVWEWDVRRDVVFYDRRWKSMLG
ncbi:MAG TPA: hypothetical protein VF832_20550, partial [Longimicrobiales bacterium]